MRSWERFVGVKTYISDGQCDPTRLPIFFAIALPACAGLAAVYQVLAWFMPCVGWVTALLMFGYLLCVGKVLEYAGILARNRSRAIHLLCSFVVVLFAYYVAWVTFFTVVFEQINFGSSGGMGVPTGLIWNPLDMAVYIPRMAEVGYRTIGSSSSGSNSAISGVFMWIIWLVEAVVIVILPPFFSLEFLGKPFFKGVQRWGSRRRLNSTYASDTMPTTAAGMLADDSFAWIGELRPYQGIDAMGFEFTEHPDEPGAFLTITRNVEKVVKKKRVIQPVPLVAHIELSADQRKAVSEQLASIGAKTQVPARGSERDEEIEAAGWDQAAASAGPAAPGEGRDAAADSRFQPAPRVRRIKTPAASEEEVDPDAIAARHRENRRTAKPAPPAAPPPPSPPPPNPQAKDASDEWDQ